MSSFRVEVAKEKKALEAEYDAGFESIFNYGYSCCVFAHNICGSKPKIPNGMSGTSKPLTPDFFCEPSMPPPPPPMVVVPIGAGVALKAGVSEGIEHSSTTGAKVGH